MYILLGIALKSLLIAGLALGLLELMKRRSAAERSSIAHIGLLALVLLAVAPLVLPSWNIETPALASQAPAVEAPVQAPAPAVSAPQSATPIAATETFRERRSSTIAASSWTSCLGATSPNLPSTTAPSESTRAARACVPETLMPMKCVCGVLMFKSQGPGGRSCVDEE